jgi:low affinity Fe/Cu permease
MKKKSLRFVNKLYRVISSPFSAIVIVCIVLVWFVIGSIMQFSDTWFKAFDIFAFTTTLIMVFIIESIEYTDMEALQKKLDEIITKLPHTDNDVAEIEKKIRGEIEE